MKSTSIARQAMFGACRAPVGADCPTDECGKCRFNGLCRWYKTNKDKLAGLKPKDPYVQTCFLPKGEDCKGGPCDGCVWYRTNKDRISYLKKVIEEKKLEMNTTNHYNKENQMKNDSKCTYGLTKSAERRLKLSSPWNTYVRQVKAMFGKDPEIDIEYSEDDMELKLFVRNFLKADALQTLMPDCKEFGNVVLKIMVVPPNKMKCDTDVLIKHAFEGNPVFKDAVMIRPEGTSNPFTYAVFANSTVQMWNDNLADPNGLVTTLYQDVAQEVLDLPKGVYCCTEQGDDVIR